jgi:chorismate mutase
MIPECSCDETSHPRGRRSLLQYGWQFWLLMGAALIGCGPDDADRPQSADASAQRETATAPPASVTDDSVEQATGQLVDLLRQRLALMPDVARWKRANDRPVSDPERERILLAALVNRAALEGLDPSRVEDFVSAQFAASRQWQQELFDRWEVSGGPGGDTPVPDLERELRPEITRLSEEMLKSLARLDALASTRPQAVRQSLIERAERTASPGADAEAPPEAAWQHVRQSLRQWAETIPQKSQAAPAAQ